MSLKKLMVPFVARLPPGRSDIRRGNGGPYDDGSPPLHRGRPSLTTVAKRSVKIAPISAFGMIFVLSLVKGWRWSGLPGRHARG